MGGVEKKMETTRGNGVEFRGLGFKEFSKACGNGI